MNTTATPVSDNATSVSTKTTKVVFGNFGNGRYSPAMEEVYKDTIRLLSFSESQAHATAAQVGRDAGQIDNQKVKLGYGKIGGKDNKIGLKAVSDSVKVNCTWALSIARICVDLEALKKIGATCDNVTLTENIQSQCDDAAWKLQGISASEMEKLVEARKA